MCGQYEKNSNIEGNNLDLNKNSHKTLKNTGSDRHESQYCSVTSKNYSKDSNQICYINAVNLDISNDDIDNNQECESTTQ